MIKATQIIQVKGAKEFNQDLGAKLIKFESEGYIVEVSGFTAVAAFSGIVYSALIICRS